MYKETLSIFSNNPNTIPFPKLTKEKSKILDGGITEKELFIALKSMKNNKSLGNDGLTKEFYITFWNEVKGTSSTGSRKIVSCKTIHYIAKTSSNRIKQKKGLDKMYIQNWRTIFLLNVDVKLIFKALVERLKNFLPEIISPNQNAYVKNRCISEEGELISDHLETSEVLIKEGFLVTIDIEKVFHSVNHHFLIAILEKICFGTELIEWIKPLLNNKNSRVINGEKTSKDFKLERGT